MEIKLTNIDPTAIKATNIRTVNEKDDKMIKNSIFEKGLIYPILVRKLTAEEKEEANTKAEYGIIDGHRRYEAVKKLSGKAVKCIEYSHPEDNKTALISNVARLQMNELDKAKAVYEITKKDKKSYSVVARELGVSKSYVGKLVLMWENEINGLKNIDQDNKLKIDPELNINENLFRNVTAKVKEYSKITEITKKVELKNDLKKIIKQLQNEIFKIDEEEEVKEFIKNERVEKLKEARAKAKEAKIQAENKINE